MFERTIKLIGEENLEKIKNKTVCIVGLGGVGGSACEALVRSGIENFIIIDYDTIDKSNLNRQIITTRDNIDNKKVFEMEKRIKSINDNCNVYAIDNFINYENIDIIFNNKIDYLIDACDSVFTKELLISKCLENKIKFISCMGTGNKLDPSKLEITDIRKTSYDPLAKILRKYVAGKKTNKKIMVVSSTEKPIRKDCLSSLIFVPATSGVLCANYIIRDILDK